jgi:hypothetical protein
MAALLPGAKFVGRSALRDCFFGKDFGKPKKCRIFCGRVLAP